MSTQEPCYVVVGGGIAGVTCIETLSYLHPSARLVLISASPLIKKVTNFVQLTRHGETFDVEERPLWSVNENHPNLEVVHASVEQLSASDQTVTTSCGKKINYDKLCICTGGRPKLLATDNPYVLGIRDTQSVKNLQEKLATCRRVVIVGNGGIATELVYELEGCQVIWAIRDTSISHTFVDPGAGQFFLEHLNKDKVKPTEQQISKRLKYTSDVDKSKISTQDGFGGGALGPDWAYRVDMKGAEKISHNVSVEYSVEVAKIMTPDEFRQIGMTEEKLLEDTEHISDWPIYVSLTNDKTFGCDLIVSATGVTPLVDPFLDGNQFDLAEDGGLKVNGVMETTEKNVYAAGDACTACWEWSPNWVQMRLWSQARQMGCYAAKCMVASQQGETPVMDFCFELFAHVTSFFNFKVVLLGMFNSQGLGSEQEVLLRCTKGVEYIKVILVEDRIVGAVLVGDTDLEETFENLILNRTDLSPFKEHLLDPAVDIEDFFD